MINKRTRYFIGIDIGTTNIKGALYSSNGKLVSSSILSYPSYTPFHGYHEQDPKDWINGFYKTLENLCSDESVKTGLESISVSTQGGTVVAVDKDFKPLYPAMTWLDRRGKHLLEEDKELRQKNIWFYNKTGWRLDSNISFMPLYWLRNKKRDLFDKIDKVLFVNDYLLWHITGNNCQDPSSASITLFYNVKEGKWDKKIMDLLGLDESNFSEVKRSGELVGYLKKDIYQNIGISSKVKVINGGHDQYCASIGAGILDESDILIATGTAWVFFKLINDPVFDSKRLFAIGRNIIEKKYGLIYSIPAAGASVRWFALNLLNLSDEKKLFDIISKEKDKLMAKNNDILFYPYLTGNFGPDFNIRKKASLLNLELNHDRLDILKAIMEGVAFQLNKIMEVMSERSMTGERIKMVGGAAKSEIWPAILADITGLDILIPKDFHDDYATKGAAILSGVGCGIFSSLGEGFKKLDTGFTIISPGKNTNYYKNKYKDFKNNY